MVKIAVRQRDKDVCATCGYDCRAARKEWVRLCHEKNLHTRSFAAMDLACHRKPEYDHIIPFSEGGLTVVENMRTLCSACHKTRTAEWRKTKTKHKT
jgi:5-methylcytosine-specific restriction endonuclease McrA